MEDWNEALRILRDDDFPILNRWGYRLSFKSSSSLQPPGSRIQLGKSPNHNVRYCLKPLLHLARSAAVAAEDPVTRPLFSTFVRDNCQGAKSSSLQQPEICLRYERMARACDLRSEQADGEKMSLQDCQNLVEELLLFCCFCRFVGRLSAWYWWLRLRQELLDAVYTKHHEVGVYASGSAVLGALLWFDSFSCSYGKRHAMMMSQSALYSVIQPA